MKLRQARTETTICYAVLIRRKDGTAFFCSGKGASTSLFFERRQAVEYKKDLAAELKWPLSKIRVVKVESIIREVSK
jgi:1,4-dihydroxy-2-naphthoyl-CoA synthase